MLKDTIQEKEQKSSITQMTLENHSFCSLKTLCKTLHYHFQHLFYGLVGVGWIFGDGLPDFAMFGFRGDTLG